MALYFKKSIEFSYSFQFADAVRDSIIRPWKLPMLPVEMWKRHRIIRDNKKYQKSETPFLFIIDYQKFSQADRYQFQSFFNSLDKAEIFIIGDEQIDGASFHFPSIRSTNKSKKDWNNDLAQLLTVVITMTKPEKLVFIGQYPYAGLMSILKKIEPKINTAWIAIHAKEQSLTERSGSFGHLLQWPQPNKRSFIHKANTVYLSNDLKNTTRNFLLKEVERFGLNEGTRENSKIQILAENDEVDVEFEEKQLFIVTVLHSEDSPTKNIHQSPNHFYIYEEYKEYFEHQIHLMFDAIKRKSFPGPRNSVIEEKAWFDVYSSF